jgi:hypothetical protein
MSDGKLLEFNETSFIKRANQPKHYIARIEFATTPSDLLMNAMGIVINEQGIQYLEANYVGSLKSITKDAQGMEIRRYGRLTLCEVKPLVDRI